MKFTGRILFPTLLSACIITALASEMAAGPMSFSPSEIAAPDTVIYPKDHYKARRVGNFETVSIADSLLGGPDTLIYDKPEELDTVKHLTARDTIVAPDSLKELDPFRYKYYVALIDSLTHRQVSDSLRASGDSLLLCDAIKLDSLYKVDSIFRAKAAFEAWYASLSKEEKKKYDFEQKELRKKAKADSLQAIKEEQQAIKDSITKNTPRILDTYAVADTMHYKRIIAWTADRDFQDLNVYVPDTSFNYHFYDYDFQRKDVNATWLGVAGSPVQTYNFFKREKYSGTGFWDSYGAWSYTPENFIQYNSKTPHTELAYFGTLMAGDEKESDNIHFLSTQNITPELNFSILYEKWGGGGILTNEKTANKTFGFGVNYLGKKYLLNTGYISNSISMGENGGIVDLSEIRDTTLESREVKVAMSNASSAVKKNTFYLDQQLRIPFNFINERRLAKDSTYVASDNITTAFIGHALEFSSYGRRFTNGSLTDTIGRKVLDNKLYIRLQPWTEESFISKMDIGIGDQVDKFHNVSATDTLSTIENDLYAYAGVSGGIGKAFDWKAKARFSFAGRRAGDFEASVAFDTRFYPFRKAKTSPLKLGASLSTSILLPEFYERHFYSNVNELFRWDNSLERNGVSKAELSIDIPHWKFSLDAGYALLSNYTYYNTTGLVQQSSDPISVLSASLRKEFVFWDKIHLDNRILAQYSSDQSALPLPALALNLKYFIQLPIQPGVMDMQIGLNGWWNTKWYSPQWNYITGTFANQDEWQYNNGPFFDLFINVQWKTCCIFIKAQNLGAGWPMDHADYFSAHRHIVTTGFTPSLKLGIFWPFYISPTINRQANK